MQPVVPPDRVTGMEGDAGVVGSSDPEGETRENPPDWTAPLPLTSSRRGSDRNNVFQEDWEFRITAFIKERINTRPELNTTTAVDFAGTEGRMRLTLSESRQVRGWRAERMAAGVCGETAFNHASLAFVTRLTYPPPPHLPEGAFGLQVPVYFKLKPFREVGLTLYCWKY